IFVLSNGGYVSIRQSQLNFFGRLVGESSESGVSFPDMVKVGMAYGIRSMRIDQPEFVCQIVEALDTPGPILCEVVLDPNQPFEPRLKSKQLPDGRIVSPPLEDMYPFLDEEELLENLLIPPMET
ncbi:MAG: thiamine pyrophosphate-binding protein, partial [Chloroflexota bacterium]|nr:thiamine pyrophosphate-binding protein [Chloroflexota bacterium]